MYVIKLKNIPEEHLLRQDRKYDQILIHLLTVLRFNGFFFGTIFLRGLLHFLNAYTGHIFQTQQYRTILIDFNDFFYQNDLGKNLLSLENLTMHPQRLFRPRVLADRAVSN